MMSASALETVERYLRLRTRLSRPPAAPPLEKGRVPTVEVCPSRRCTSTSWRLVENKAGKQSTRCRQCDAHWPSRTVYGRGHNQAPSRAEIDWFADIGRVLATAIVRPERQVIEAWILARQSPDDQRRRSVVVAAYLRRRSRAAWSWRRVEDLATKACEKIDEALERRVA